jgi:hypothetical protein
MGKIFMRRCVTYDSRLPIRASVFLIIMTFSILIINPIPFITSVIATRYCRFQVAITGDCND